LHPQTDLVVCPHPLEEIAVVGPSPLTIAIGGLVHAISRELAGLIGVA
jgi:hypothetical protein